MGNLIKTVKNYSQVFRGKKVFVEPNKGRVAAQYIKNILLLLCRSTSRIIKENSLENLFLVHH